MITFKPIVVPSNRRRDGTYLVAIRVYHAGACRRIPTNLVAGPGDLTRSGRIKSAAILDRAGEIIDRMRDAVSGLTEADLAGKDVGWVMDRINCADRLHTLRLDFFDFADGFIAGLSPGARGQYVTACNTFAAFLGRREYATAKVNKGLARWCEEEGVERFTFYAARHTWATIARRAGVEKATVDECLVHVGDFPLTDIYAERSWELMDAANRVVLSRFTF